MYSTECPYIPYPVSSVTVWTLVDQFSSVQSLSRVRLLQPRGHTTPPYASPTPGVDSNSCPLSWWCHPTISSSFIPFSCCLQSFPASGSFQISWFFTSGGQSIGASASVLPMNMQGWFPLGLNGLISLLSKGLSRVLQHHSPKATILQCSAFFIIQLSHLYMTTGKTIALTSWAFVGKVMSLLFNKLSKLVLNKEQVSFNFMAAVTICSDFAVQENNVCHCFHFSPIYLPWSEGTRCRDLRFLNVEF